MFGVGGEVDTKMWTTLTFWCLIMGVTWGNLKEAQESCEKVVFDDGGQMGGLFVTVNKLQLSINVQKLYLCCNAQTWPPLIKDNSKLS